LTELLCIGNAIVDMFVSLDSVRMNELGIVHPVQHIGCEQMEKILEELNSRTGAAAVTSGGGAANVAKISAMLGINAAFAGCVGHDEPAAFFEKELNDAGVKALLSTGVGKTGRCLICDSGSETRIAASPGAALEITEADVDRALSGGAEAVVLDGYMLDRRPIVQHILQQSNKRGIPVALDAASVFQMLNKTEEILHYSRNYPLLLFFNADEAIVFYNVIKHSRNEEINLSDRDKEKIILDEVCPILKIITDGEIFPIVVIKLGSRGALVAAGGNIYREETFSLMSGNTVGAGDAFCAAFLAAWIRGRPLSKCAELGNRVARQLLEVPGTMIKSGKLKSFAKNLRK